MQKIVRIGQSAAKHKSKRFVKVQRLGIETKFLNGLSPTEFCLEYKIPKSARQLSLKDNLIEDIVWTIVKAIEVKIKSFTIT